MPYKVASNVEGCSGYAVIKPETGELVACHRTKSDAARHVRALYANVPDAVKKATTESLMVLHDKIHNSPMDAGALATHHYLSTELARRGLDLSMEDEFSKEIIIDPELTLDGVELEELFGGEEELIEDLVMKWEEGEVDVFKVAFALWGDGLEILVNEEIKENVDKVAQTDTFTPPASVAAEAKRALQWIREGKAGGGFTDVGRARAAQLAARRPVSLRTIKRMRSYFARHTPDKKAEGFTRGEKDYPSGGRVAWDAWGGDAGESWVKGILRRVESMEKHLQGKHDQKAHAGGKLGAFYDFGGEISKSLDSNDPMLREAAATLEVMEEFLGKEFMKDEGIRFTRMALEPDLEGAKVKIAKTEDGLAGAISYAIVEPQELFEEQGLEFSGGYGSMMYISYLGSTGLVDGTGTALATSVFEEAANQGVGIMLESASQGATAFWKKMGLDYGEGYFGASASKVKELVGA